MDFLFGLQTSIGLLVHACPHGHEGDFKKGKGASEIRVIPWRPRRVATYVPAFLTIESNNCNCMYRSCCVSPVHYSICQDVHFKTLDSICGDACVYHWCTARVLSLPTPIQGRIMSFLPSCPLPTGFLVSDLDQCSKSSILANLMLNIC